MMRALPRLRPLRAAAGLAAAAAGLVLLSATPAQAAPAPGSTGGHGVGGASLAVRHPLGNFSMNQYLGLVLHPDRVDAAAVVDIAEIPTLQERPGVDTDGDGTVSDAERGAHATAACTSLAGAVDAQVGDDRLEWTVTSSGFEYAPGAGGLDVSRLACSLTAPALLTDVTLTVINGYLTDRIGWREITARGEGVGLIDPTVPATSVSDELRAYPDDLLTSVLDVRSATLRVTPGAGTSAVAPVALPSGGDPLSRWMSTLDRFFADLAGGPLTPLVGIVAVLLAVVLGAGHALLPGHGKTVLAAYLAGRAGRPRDALSVAGTVTLTHTGGVLILGLVLTAGSALAGDRIIGWLGVVSGIVVLVVGATMLRSVLRRRGLAHLFAGHTHDHDEGHTHDHGDRHTHDDAHGHTHGHIDGAGHTHGHGSEHDHAHGHGHGHDHVHPHGHGRPHRIDGGQGRSRRWSLAGIGIAGGLVPSPSALVVLLAAIGLGRTAFGVLLVIAYGAGMAATLTGAGLLLLALQRRLEATAQGAGTITSRLRGLAARLSAVTPAATATLVVIVGAGLALRAASTVIA